MEEDRYRLKKKYEKLFLHPRLIEGSLTAWTKEGVGVEALKKIKRPKDKHPKVVKKNLQLKAYCGDGLLRTILGECFTLKQISLGKYESNKHLTECYLKWAKLSPKDFRSYNKYGTLYEAHIYFLFKNDGYETAKRFIQHTIRKGL